ncbi:hypothetical protein Hanom_Chr04g00378081 [Helianthus anomalus]
MRTSKRTMFDEISGNLVFVKGHDTEITDGCYNLIFIKLAAPAVGSCVWIVFFPHKPTGFESVLEGTVHKTSIAPGIT